jgi:hypothetical protein
LILRPDDVAASISFTRLITPSVGRSQPHSVTCNWNAIIADCGFHQFSDFVGQVLKLNHAHLCLGGERFTSFFYNRWSVFFYAQLSLRSRRVLERPVRKTGGGLVGL